MYNIICLPVSVRPRNVDELGTCTHDLVYSHVIILLSATTLCVTLHIFCRHIPYPCRPQHCRRTCGSQIIAKYWWVYCCCCCTIRYIIMYSTFTRPGRTKFENRTRARRVCRHTAQV